MSRAFWILLGVGILLRVWALDRPLIDGHHFRQSQTADAISSMLREGGLPLDAEASWRGDTGARVVQEFPFYNHAVVLLVRATGLPLTVAGKLVSVLFWIVAFLALQGVWKRLLAEREAFWANLLFVFAPLSVFFGQAVMPESLVLAVTFGFIAFWLRHLETGATLPLAGAAVVALIGLLVKPPSTFYLGVFAAATLVAAGRWKQVFDWRYLLTAGLLALPLKLWMDYANAVCAPYFADFSASNNVSLFFGPLSERVNPAFWFRIAAYNISMIATPLAFVLAAGAFLPGRPQDAAPGRARLLACWGVALLVFVLVFGPHTASNHSYYNLPMLAPLCALFGMAAIKVGQILDSRWGSRGLWGARVVFLAAALLVPLPVTAYVFGQDIQYQRVAEWVRANTRPDDLTIIRMAGNPYPHITTISFNAGRRVWIWSPYLKEDERARAIETSSYAILTLPMPDKRNPVVRAWHRLRGFRDPQVETGFPPSDRFEVLLRQEGFVVFGKKLNTDSADGGNSHEGR